MTTPHLYNPSARSGAEHFANCAFQMANVEGWLMSRNTDCAAIKAECLLADAQRLVNALKRQSLEEKIQPTPARTE